MCIFVKKMWKNICLKDTWEPGSNQLELFLNLIRLFLTDTIFDTRTRFRDYILFNKSYKTRIHKKIVVNEKQLTRLLHDHYRNILKKRRDIYPKTSNF